MCKRVSSSHLNRSSSHLGIYICRLRIFTSARIIDVSSQVLISHRRIFTSSFSHLLILMSSHPLLFSHFHILNLSHMLCFDEKSYMQYTCGYAPVRSWAIRRLVICIPPKKNHLHYQDPGVRQSHFFGQLSCFRCLKWQVPH